MKASILTLTALSYLAGSALASGTCAQATVRYKRNWSCATTQDTMEKSCRGLIGTIKSQSCKQKYGGCEADFRSTTVQDDQKWNCRQQKTATCEIFAWRYRSWEEAQQSLAGWNFDSYTVSPDSPKQGVKCDG
ncbi:uncharacterized protein CTRU02_215359 [Colletotrichum truncatum]|uniref:Uncharacterized protein n=1 Tax=Colletotrichum truncatum TaxID=5467 RepID=A0ACC3YD07_COLTU|nr:uncharacterized protein CTRU02_13315 [Colletotrichum truncatum]KAF6783551.1 hypothetical protein CTRU02_13315 [Colletotrichum truncatum]